MINEVGWGGTTASSDDQWVELYNPGTSDLDLTGWRLVAETGSLDVTLAGTITAGGYFLLERGHDNVISNIPANQIYSGSLAVNNEVLRLRMSTGQVVDTANHDGGTWPAGSTNPVCSMERYRSTLDGAAGWATTPASYVSGALDAASNAICGTPGQVNWAYSVTPTRTPTGTAPRAVVINEVAWAGTKASSNDEWIELYNPTTNDVDLAGWVIRADDGSPTIPLTGIIHGGEYYLLERGDDNTVNDVAARLVYTQPVLSNTPGEILKLISNRGSVVDTANLGITSNPNKAAWPAGLASPTYASMERRGLLSDSPAAWMTYASTAVYAHDRANNAIKGTPGRANWANTVTPTPSRTPTATRTLTRTPTRTPNNRVVVDLVYLNEIVPRAGHDWNSDGQVDVYDEFVEVVNLSDHDVSLKGWVLNNDTEDEYPLPSVTIKPNQHIAFFRLTSGITLSDAGATVQLTNSKGQLLDAFTYPVVKSPDLSWCRLPDGKGKWSDTCIPSPFKTNTASGSLPVSPDQADAALTCLVPDTAPLPFIEAECESPGGGVYNPILWGENLPGQDLWIDPQFDGPILLY